MTPPVDAQITFVYTDDLAASAPFYEEALGLELALDQGTCRIWRVRPGAYIGLCERDEAPRPDGIILTLVSDDVEGWAERLRAHGVAIERGPEHNARFAITHLFARDPNGYLIEIQRFEDPRWPKNP